MDGFYRGRHGHVLVLCAWLYNLCSLAWIGHEGMFCVYGIKIESSTLIPGQLCAPILCDARGMRGRGMSGSWDRAWVALQMRCPLEDDCVFCKTAIQSIAVSAVSDAR